MRYFTVNLLRTVNIEGRMDVPAFILGVVGIYCGTGGIGNVKFVI